MDEFKVFDLGFAMARARRGNNPGIVVVTPASTDGEVYEPAQTVGVFRQQDVEALRDACDFALGVSDEHG